MPLLFNLVYLFTLILLWPWLLYKALTAGKYRRGMWPKFTGLTPRRQSAARCVWFHGVSVGEIHLLQPVIAAFRERHPDWECVISTTTDTGYDEAKKRFADCAVFFWPLDFTWAVGRALGRIKPDLVVLAEGEVWPNFMSAAQRAGVPVALINGRMSPRSYRHYRWIRRLTRPVFEKLALCAVQTHEYAHHYRTLGARADVVRVTGSVKYDGACSDRANPRTRDLKQLFGVAEPDLVWVAGSTQAPEEQLVLDIFRPARGRFPTLRLFLVPRQRDRFDEVAALLERSGLAYQRRSQLTEPSADRSAIILVDTIGELGALWGLADLAFVGGSLDGQRGGQNMIEPAAYGAAVVFGPHVWNFRATASKLVEMGAAIQVADAVDLESVSIRLLGDPHERARLGDTARQFVKSQQGATARTMALLDELIGENCGGARAA